MPEINTDETPKKKKSRNERTEAKFFEDVDKLIAQIIELGAEYAPPNPTAALAFLQARRAETASLRTNNQQAVAINEADRNHREMLYKPLNSDVSSYVNYAKSAGKPANEVAALQSIAREIGGKRAAAPPKDDSLTPDNTISVSHLSFASRADAYARFTEQYDALNLSSKEDRFKTATLRAQLEAIRSANAAVITSNAAADTTGQALDVAAFTAVDSLMNGCISGKLYLKSKYKTTGEPYKNISRTRFRLPSRLR